MAENRTRCPDGCHPQGCRCLTDAERVQVRQPRHGLVQDRHRVQAAPIKGGALHILQPERQRGELGLVLKQTGHSWRGGTSGV